MKKILPVLVFLLLQYAICHAQNEGYKWSFEGTPFNSLPAVAGAAGHYPLSTFGSGSITAGVSDNVGLGTSCTGNINVGSFIKPFGLLFSNAPQFVNNTYTIEMVFKFNDLSGYRRVLNFEDPNNINIDKGVYIAGGALNFYEGFNLGANVTGAIFTVNIYFQLDFVRDGNTKIITCYKDGIQVGTFADNNDNFIPKASALYGIAFFKDNADNGEESSGSVAKIKVYNYQLNTTEITQNFNSICQPQPAEGYAWPFSTTPFNSIPAVLGSTSNYTLTTVGSGSITAAISDNVGLGTSCTGNINVADFTKPLGLTFSNSPVTIGDTYTIEMVFTFYGPTPRGRKRMVNFESPSSGVEKGFYVWGNFNMYNGFGFGSFYGSAFTENVYAQVDIVRDGVTKSLSFYKDGVNIGNDTDPGDDFIPKASGGFAINFFKDCNGCGEESSGKVAKISVYNYVLNATEIQQNFNTICSSLVLPVSMLSFDAIRSATGVKLSWVTASEQNNKGFEIQRSADGINFNAIGWVNGVGNSSTMHSYSFTDAAPLKGKNFYRLKQIDLDAKSVLSDTRKINFDAAVNFTVYPNPVKNEALLQLNENAVTIRLTDVSGKELWRREKTNAGTITIPMQQLSSGLYFIQVTNSNGEMTTQKIIKQ